MTHDIGPWSKISMDICYFEGRALLIVSDYYSNCMTVRRLQNQSVAKVRKILLGIFETHGLPQAILCDNEQQFRSIFKEFARKFSISHNF